MNEKERTLDEIIKMNKLVCEIETEGQAGEQGETAGDKKTTVDGRTLHEAMNAIGECTLIAHDSKAIMKDAFPEVIGEARIIGEKMQAEIDTLREAVDAYVPMCAQAENDRLKKHNHEHEETYIAKHEFNQGDIRAACGASHAGKSQHAGAAVDGRTFKEILNDMICINSLVGTGEGANRMRKNIEVVRTRGEKMQVEYRKLDEKWKTARKAIDEYERGDKVQREHEELKNRLDIADAYKPSPDIEKRCDAMFASRNDGRIHFPGRDNREYPRHTTYLKDGNYISFSVVISGTKRGDVKIPVIGHGRNEQGSYITLKLGSLSLQLPIDFDVEKLGG